MKLSDFANKGQTSTKNNQTQSEKKDSKENNNQYEKMYDEYKNMDSDQLLGKLFESVNEQKNKGNFNYEDISARVKMIMPYLSSEQQKNILTLLEKIK